MEFRTERERKVREVKSKTKPTTKSKVKKSDVNARRVADEGAVGAFKHRLTKWLLHRKNAPALL